MRRILALLLTVAPFVAAAIAALSVRRDFRMVWMALAATVVSRVVFAYARARTSASSATITSIVAATLASSAVGMLLGARNALGVVLVAVVLSGSAALGAVVGATPVSRQ